MDRSSDQGETLEQHVCKVHRLYLAALMRIEKLEGEAARIDHELLLRLLQALLQQLGYVPRGLASRSEIERDFTAGQVVRAGRAEPWPERSARAATRAEMRFRSA